MIESFTLEPVKQGFDEYELKMGSIQTIMMSTGASLEEVNKYLQELNTYSDKTIYSFQDMTSNIGKFTNAGVGLEDAVMAIQGVWLPYPVQMRTRLPVQCITLRRPCPQDMSS